MKTETLTTGDVMKTAKSCNLSSDFDHLDPCDDLHDINTGKYLQALSELPANIRQLMQEGDMYIEVREIDDRYQVVRITKKREPEYNQGTDNYFVFDRYGSRIPLDEKQLSALLGIEENSEDVFNHPDCELVGLQHEHSVPKDTWDITYSAEEYIRAAEALIQDEVWQLKPRNEKIEDLRELSDGKEVLVERKNYYRTYQGGIYSANWYPYPEDKRIHSMAARKIASVIKKGKMTKRQLGQAIGSNESISATDRGKLWRLWQDNHLVKNGSVDLMPWQYKKALTAKLIREGVSVEETTQRVQVAMKKIFNQGPSYVPIKREALTIDNAELPTWLEAVPLTDESSVEDCEFTAFDWLPEESHTEATVEQQLIEQSEKD